jgi:phosphate/sulfate permease
MMNDEKASKRSVLIVVIVCGIAGAGNSLIFHVVTDYLHLEGVSKVAIGVIVAALIGIVAGAIIWSLVRVAPHQKTSSGREPR